ncbi:MAG: FAD-dependent oxidoreductase [Clostridiales bacterium]|nr:FAD-dependent oxidoreductase [Clostridiales bacterium]
MPQEPPVSAICSHKPLAVFAQLYYNEGRDRTTGGIPLYDLLILGSGPAGLAAAIAGRSRNLKVLVVSNPPSASPLAKAERIDNYPGLPGVTGAELLDKLQSHADALGAEFLTGKALSALDMGRNWCLTVGQDVAEGHSLIVTSGVTPVQHIPGEERLLGRGVSYCAVCDGMLYRKRSVVVIGRSSDAPQEAAWLSSIGCQVTYVAAKRPEGLPEDIPFVRAGRLEIEGADRVEAVLADGARLPCEGVFLLRSAVAPGDLLPGLAFRDGYIAVDRSGRTNLPRVYAAGDCTGKPFQIAKAVGEGQVAALTAAEDAEASILER